MYIGPIPRGNAHYNQDPTWRHADMNELGHPATISDPHSAAVSSCDLNNFPTGVLDET
jgi:hypothetical protein